MDEIITLDYGSGGKKTSALIDELIVPSFDNEALSQLTDGAVLKGTDTIVFSTDSFVVSPQFFPGGDIGKLSVCGTVNDVAVSGGIPKYLSLSFIIEEGFEPSFGARPLKRFIQSRVETIIGRLIIAKDLAPQTEITVDLENGELTAKI